MGLDNPLHIAFLLVLLLLVFGAKRLPEMGRSLGEGLRGFKSAVSGDAIAPATATPAFAPAIAAPATATPAFAPAIAAPATATPAIATQVATPAAQDPIPTAEEHNQR